MREFVGYGDQVNIEVTYHGQSKTPLYRRWQQLKRRVLLPSFIQYKDYGGRGIKLDKRWLKFENFLADMGMPPNNSYQIDREQVNGHYCKENCRWVTKNVSVFNRRKYSKSPTTGVRLNKRNGKFVSRIIVDNQYYHIGSYDTLQEAKSSYEIVCKEWYG